MPELQTITISGKTGTVAFLDADLRMVEPASAKFARVVFKDGTSAFYLTQEGLRTAGDVEGHEFHGNQWTHGITSGVFKEPERLLIGYRADANPQDVLRDVAKNVQVQLEKVGLTPRYTDAVIGTRRDDAQGIFWHSDRKFGLAEGAFNVLQRDLANNTWTPSGLDAFRTVTHELLHASAPQDAVIRSGDGFDESRVVMSRLSSSIEEGLVDHFARQATEKMVGESIERAQHPYDPFVRGVQLAAGSDARLQEIFQMAGKERIQALGGDIYERLQKKGFWPEKLEYSEGNTMVSLAASKSYYDKDPSSFAAAAMNNPSLFEKVEQRLSGEELRRSMNVLSNKYADILDIQKVRVAVMTDAERDEYLAQKKKSDDYWAALEKKERQQDARIKTKLEEIKKIQAKRAPERAEKIRRIARKRAA